MKNEHCLKCGREFPFTKEYFKSDKSKKYGLRYICLECDRKYANIQHYKHRYNIILDNNKMFESYTPIEWYEFTINNKNIRSLPSEVDTKENCSIIIKYVIDNIIKIDNLNKLRISDMKKYKLQYMLKHWDNHLTNAIMDIYQLDKFKLSKYTDKPRIGKVKWTDDNIISYIDSIIEDLPISDILNGNITNKMLNDNFNLGGLLTKFGGKNRLFIWYYNKKNIIYNGHNVNEFDFKLHCNNFYDDINNVTILLKDYAENNLINDVINSNSYKKINEWYHTYWNTFLINKIISARILYKRSLYEWLILCYPEIKEKKLIFEWEIQSTNKWKIDDFRINALKELVFYRLQCNNILNIPQYLNSSLLKDNYSGFLANSLKYYKSYHLYKWACEAFPECKDYWKESDFGNIYIGCDGIQRLNSIKEKYVFDFIYDNLNIKSIKAVGLRTKKYKFSVGNSNNIDKFYYPDFIIDEIKFNKLIVLEYYGLYNTNKPSGFIQAYIDKTHRKNEYYKSRDDIYFIDLYPDDLKNNFEGVRNKLTSFFMFNFNIDIKKEAS